MTGIENSVIWQHKNPFDDTLYYFLVISSGISIIPDTSLADLAAQLGMTDLVDTVNQYNEYVTGGTDKEFGRTDKLQAFETGPFYAVKTIPYCSWSTGGPMANENMEVLGEDGAVIPGLYVAGEGAGHALVAGKTPISGMYLGRDATFGIDAADHAAEFAINK